VTLDRDKLLSFYFCSGYSMHKPGRSRVSTATDIGGVGGC
jgi:hypothetical protein